MSFDELRALTTAALDQPWVRALAILVFGILVVRLLGALIHRRMKAGTNAHWALVARKITAYTGTAVVLLAVARTLGLDLTALAATAGVATIAVGFAAQTSLSNLIAGLFLLVDRPFEVGDTVEIEGRLGIVREISLLSTLVRTFDSILVRWPNEVVLKSTILNYTRFPARRVDIKVGIAYGSDLPQARKVLLAALQELESILIEPVPEVVTRGFLDSAVELEVRVWVAQSLFLRGRTETVETIHRALAEAGIEIPFPQVKVWRSDAG